MMEGRQRERRVNLAGRGPECVEFIKIRGRIRGYKHKLESYVSLQHQATGRKSCWVAYNMNHNRNGSRGAKTLTAPKNNVLIFDSHYASVCPSRLGSICHRRNEPIVC